MRPAPISIHTRPLQQRLRPVLARIQAQRQASIGSSSPAVDHVLLVVIANESAAGLIVEVLEQLEPTHPQAVPLLMALARMVDAAEAAGVAHRELVGNQPASVANLESSQGTKGRA